MGRKEQAPMGGAFPCLQKRRGPQKQHTWARDVFVARLTHDAHHRAYFSSTMSLRRTRKLRAIVLTMRSAGVAELTPAAV